LVVFQDGLAGRSEKEIQGSPEIFGEYINAQGGIDPSAIMTEALGSVKEKGSSSGPIEKKSEDDIHLGIIVTESESEGNAVLNSIKDGMSFEDAAMKHSKGPNADSGGDIGFINPTDMEELLQKEIAKTAVGGISGLVKASNGYMILKRFGD